MSPWSVWQKWIETLWDFCKWDRGTWKFGVDFDVLQRLQRLSAVSLCTASYKKLFGFTIHIPGISWRCPVCFMCSALVVLVCTLGVVIIHFYQNYTVSAVITASSSLLSAFGKYYTSRSPSYLLLPYLFIYFFGSCYIWMCTSYAMWNRELCRWRDPTWVAT